jgi:hypothetical protein
LIKLQRAPRRSIQRGDSPASRERRMPWHVGASGARRMVKQACTPFLAAVHQDLQWGTCTEVEVSGQTQAQRQGDACETLEWSALNPMTRRHRSGTR